MDNQEAFNAVYKHLAREGATKAVDAFGSCLYRDRQTGNCCAIGGIMPPWLLDTKIVIYPGMDGDPEEYMQVADYDDGIDSLLSMCPEVREFFDHVDLKLLNDMQEAHDLVDAGPDWQAKALAQMEQIAADWDLNDPFGKDWERPV